MKIANEYIAGLFDGEGSIGIWSQGKGEFLTTCQIGLCFSPPIRLIYDQYPEGHINYIESKNFYVFRLKGFNCVRFLEDIVPHLIVKKEQAAIALEYLDILKLRYEEQSKHRNLTETEKEERLIYINRLKELKYAYS